MAKVLATLRDYILLAHFGAGASADAIAASTTIPDLVQYVALGGLLGPVVIPHLRRARASGSERRWSDAVGQVVVWGFVVAGVLGVFGFVSATELVALLNPGLTPSTQLVAAQLLRWSMALLPLIGVAAVLRAALQTVGNVGFPAIASIFLNGLVVGVLLIGADTLGPYVFPVALAAGTVLQIGLVSWAVMHYGPPRLGAPRFQKVLAVVVWSASWRISLIAFIWYGRIIVERVLAAAAPEGTLALLNLVTRIIAALSVIASTSIGTAVLPEAIAAFQSGRATSVNHVVATSFRLTLAVGSGVALLFGLLASQSTGFAFQRTAVSAQGIETLRLLLVLAAPSIVCLGLSEVNTRLLLAVERTGLALVCALVGGGVMWTAQWAGQALLGVPGIVLGGVLGSLFYAALTTVALIHAQTFRSNGVIAVPLVTVGVSVALATVVALAVRRILPGSETSLSAFVVTGLGAVLVGGGTYLSALYFLRFPEWRYLRHLLRS